MSWKLDDILFSDYSVGVRKSSGVLDLPQLDDKGYDWLDLDSVDYWQTAADLRYNDREIVLNCWINAPGYSTFKTRLNTFYTAIKSADLRELYTPFGTTISCYVEKEIVLERKTSYLEQYQVGFFTLRLTVPGDSKYNLITTKRWTSAEGVTFPAVLKTSNCKITKTLQGAITLDMTVESNRKLDMKPWDYIDYEYANSGGETDRFVLPSEPVFVKKSTNKYIYTLSFNFYGYELMSRADYLNDLEESEFSRWGTIEDILDHIIWNYLRRGYGAGQFTKGTVVATEGKNHQFNEENCLEVLQRMCTEYELEFEFVKNDPDFFNYTINIKEKVANDKAVTLAYGKGNGQYELSRGKRVDDDFFSVLYAFGAAKNLPVGYRNGMRRLSFSDNPLKDVTTPDPEKEKNTEI